MEIQKTYREIIDLDVICSEYVQRMGKSETELSAEVKRFLKKQIAPLQEEFQEELYMNKVKCAHKDAKGILARDERGEFQITEEGEVKRVALNKALMSKHVSIHTRFIQDIPGDLNEDELDAFDGIFWPQKTS